MKKFLSVFLTVLLIFTVSGGRSNAEIRKIADGVDVDGVSPINVVVELKSPPVSVYKKGFKYRLLSVFNKNAETSYEKKVLNIQERVIKSASKFGIKPKFHYSYTFNGFSCTISPEGVKELAKMRDVKKIYPDKKAYLIRQEADKIIGADKVHKLKGPNGDYLTGKGIVVGIVDTGVDYNDTELGGGGFPNGKVIGGYDFADMDSDPMDTDGHGTHVAGIIAGNKYGVAPDAKIRVYKVFGKNSGSTATSLIIKGIDQAVKDKCNVVNISIGTVGGEGNGSDAESVAVKNAVESGVTVVAAAGNWGSRSEVLPFPLGSPASSKYAIGVGASDDSKHGIIEFEGKEIFAYYPAEAPYFAEKKYEIIYCGYGKKSDFDGKNVKGKIALVKRGDIYFGDKDLNAKKAGAVGVICFNNVAGLPTIKLVSQNNPNATGFIPFLFVSETDGAIIKKQAESNGSVFIKNKGGLGLIAPFSSEGPTADFTFKPDIVAPGVNINSTVPHNKYESWSGTSMAAPFVSGCAALLLQDKPNLSPDLVKAILMNTATILKNPDSGIPFSPLLQGTGRVNIFSAVNSNVAITPSSVLFGSGEKSKTETFSVKNFSSDVLVLSLSVKTFSAKSLNISLPKSVVVPPKSRANFGATFKADNNTDSDVFGVIYISGGSSLLHIPFLYIPEFSIPSYLENVSITKNSLAGDDTALICFNVKVGALDKEESKEFTQNIADEVKVEIYNSVGKPVEVLFDKSPIFIGEYSVPIGTKDANGNFILKNGTYFYKVSYIEPNNDPETKEYFSDVVKAEKSGSFKVSGVPTSGVAVTPESGKTLLLKPGEEFATNISVWFDKPLLNFKGTFAFDSTLLKLLSLSASDKNTTLKYTVNNGRVFFTMSGKIPAKGAVLRAVFKAYDSGSGFLRLSAASIYPFEENFVLTPLFYKIGAYVRPWDINGDKIVDSNDFGIFEKSFLLNKNDAGFNPKCDFNKDGIVDSDDFFELSKHFGEVYP